MTFANTISILKGATRRDARGVLGPRNWGGYAAAVIVRLKVLAPYALIELVLPGGSVMALLLWLYRRRKRGVGFGRFPVRILSGDIAEELGREVNSLGPARSALITKGMIYSRDHQSHASNSRASSEGGSPNGSIEGEAVSTGAKQSSRGRGLPSTRTISIRGLAAPKMAYGPSRYPLCKARGCSRNLGRPLFGSS
jgi:hypothetical protein